LAYYHCHDVQKLANIILVKVKHVVHDCFVSLAHFPRPRFSVVVVVVVDAVTETLAVAVEAVAVERATTFVLRRKQREFIVFPKF
jgi:hypothetical protein